MIKLLTTILILICLQSAAQKQTASTESFIVEGSVNQSQSFSLKDLVGLPVVKTDSIVILNHLKERAY